jgi:hypothetical protein
MSATPGGRAADPRFFGAHPARRSHRPDRSQRLRQEHLAGLLLGRLTPMRRPGASTGPSWKSPISTSCAKPSIRNKPCWTAWPVGGKPSKSTASAATSSAIWAISVYPAAGALTGQIAVRRRAQPAVAGAAIHPARQSAGDGRTDQRSRSGNAGATGRTAAGVHRNLAAGQPRPGVSG